MTSLEDAHRQHWATVVATVARSVRDLDIAEEAAAEAFATAVIRWPEDGVPDNPAGWLITTARRKAIDRIRRESARDDKQAAAQAALLDRDEPMTDPTLPDDRLRLMFTCCHPALAPEAQIALTLRLVAGLPTEAIARAFLMSDATMGQRLTRAKRKIKVAGIPYRVPSSLELTDRLAGVLRVVYLVFREGYAPSQSSDLVRGELCDEAIRLGRLLAELLPDEGEVLGLLSLMILHDSRRHTRLDDHGDLVLLADQDRTQWDRAAIAEGAELAPRALRRERGPYAVQAAIAACHAVAPMAELTDWRSIAALYGELASLDPSPAVELNRAVAVAEIDGPEAGLHLVDALLATPAGAQLATTSHQVAATRADFLRRLDRPDDAIAAYREAITLVVTDPERRFLEQRIVNLSRGT